jgi:transposase
VLDAIFDLLRTGCPSGAALRGDVAAAAARHERVALAVVKRSDRAKGFVVLAKRWIVERSFAWFGRNRRLAKDVETLIASSTAMLYLAATRLLTRRLATP